MRVIKAKIAATHEVWAKSVTRGDFIAVLAHNDEAASQLYQFWLSKNARNDDLVRDEFGDPITRKQHR